MEKEILKNKTIRIRANSYGSMFLSTYHKNPDGSLTSEKEYKFDGFMEGVDLEISIPPKCRTDYAKITAIK